MSPPVIEARTERLGENLAADYRREADIRPRFSLIDDERGFRNASYTDYRAYRKATESA